MRITRDFLFLLAAAAPPSDNIMALGLAMGQSGGKELDVPPEDALSWAEHLPNLIAEKGINVDRSRYLTVVDEDRLDLSEYGRSLLALAMPARGVAH